VTIPIRHGTLNRKVANVALPNHESGRRIDIINATLIDKRKPTNTENISKMK
jgi:hypothetical protein